MPVDVLVVAYGAADALARCLEPVTGRLQVLVVDNSSDPAVKAVAEAAGARYVDPGENLGFAGGVNTGLRRLLEGDVLLLNPDAVITVEAVEALEAALHAEPRLAAVSPSLVGDDGQPQRVTWPFPSPARTWRQAVQPGWQGPAEFLVGACLLLRREAINAIGGFDERFFLYAEETDWQRRAVLAGWSVRLVPGVVARHTGAGTSTDSERREALFHAAAETYFTKWYGRTGWTVARAGVMAGTLPRMLAGGTATRRAARQRLRLYRGGPRRIAGLDS